MEPVGCGWGGAPRPPTPHSPSNTQSSIQPEPLHLLSLGPRCPSWGSSHRPSTRPSLSPEATSQGASLSTEGPRSHGGPVPALGHSMSPGGPSPCLRLMAAFPQQSPGDSLGPICEDLAAKDTEGPRGPPRGRDAGSSHSGLPVSSHRRQGWPHLSPWSLRGPCSTAATRGRPAPQDGYGLLASRALRPQLRTVETWVH